MQKDFKKIKDIPKTQYLPVLPSGKKLGRRLYLKEVLNWLSKSFYISKPIISLTGGIVNNGFTDGDIDIVFLSPKREPQAEFRIYRAFPEEIRNRIHILYPHENNDLSLFTSNMPLYDLKFERRSGDEVFRLFKEINREEPPPLLFDSQDREDKEIHKQAALPEVKKSIDLKKISKDWLNKASYEDLKKLPKGFFSLSDHWRGKSMHGDLRIKQNEYLIGMTLLYQVEGVTKEPVTTLEQAEKLQWEQPRKFYPDMPTNAKIMAEEKATQPLIWLGMVKRVIPKGEVGATKDWPGVFNLYDFGMSYQGTKKPYFDEVWLDGQKFKKKRLVMRVLQVGEEWKEKPAEEWVWTVWLAEDEPYILSRRAILEKRTVPPKGESWLPPWWEEKIPKELSWWVEGLSEEDRANRILKARNYLVDKKELPGRPISEEKIKKQKQVKEGRFILRSHFWEGPFIKRGMPIIHYDLVIDRGLGYLHEWNLQKSPLMATSTFGLERVCEEQTPKGEDNVKWMEFEGSIPPPNISIYPVELIERLNSIYRFKVPEGVKPIDVKKKIESGKEYESKDCPYKFKKDEKVWADHRHYLYNSTVSIGNPNVAIPAYILIEDSGEVVWLEENPTFDSFIFKGKRLKGYWTWKNEEFGSELGTFELSKLPGEVKKGVDV